MKEAITTSFVLPYPPSGNTALKFSSKSGFYTSPSVTNYRIKTKYQMIEVKVPKFGKNLVVVELLMFTPDKRRRDIDNVLKTIFDALKHGQIIDDDSQINRLYVEKHLDKENPRIEIKITEWKNYAEGRFI